MPIQRISDVIAHRLTVGYLMDFITDVKDAAEFYNTPVQDSEQHLLVLMGKVI